MALACHLFTMEHVGYVQDTASSLLTHGPSILFSTLTLMSVPLLISWLLNHRHCSASKHEPFMSYNSISAFDSLSSAQGLAFAMPGFRASAR